MKKINILFENKIFSQDLGQQITKNQKDVEISFEKPDSQTELLLVDSENTELNKIAAQFKELPIVLFSNNQETSDYADLVIKKPFKLNKFLENLKNDNLLPKVRRKECLIFKEYSLYPVKKEIYSSVTEKTTKLTEKEIDIIKYLYKISPDIAGKEELLENVWGYSSDATTHTVETHIYRLRQKVEKEGGTQLIITENNGYRLNM